jgi:hypothetical protein
MVCGTLPYIINEINKLHLSFDSSLALCLIRCAHKNLRAILKTEAEARSVSIANYVAKHLNAIQHVQSIEALVSSESDVNVSINIPKNPLGELKPKTTSSPERIRTSVTGSKGQYA